MADQTLEPGTPREVREAAHRVSRHTALVRNLRLAVPALAVGLAVTYALSATPPRVDRDFAEQFSQIEEGSDGVRLTRPRYSGEDLSGRPFALDATSATRPGSGNENVSLEKPTAKTVNAAGEVVHVSSDTGFYDRSGKRATLTDNVELRQEGQGGDFTLVTDAADIDFEKQTVKSCSGVSGKGKEGTMRADCATLYQDEDRLVLEGGVKIMLEPQKKSADNGNDDES